MKNKLLLSVFISILLGLFSQVSAQSRTYLYEAGTVDSVHSKIFNEQNPEDRSIHEDKKRQ